MKLKICFINIALSLSLFCVGFLSVNTRVYAYTPEDNFYIFNPTSLHMSINVNSWDEYYGYDSSFNNGKFEFNNPYIQNVFNITLNSNGVGELDIWTFPFNPDVYDYYFLGTLTAVNNDLNKSTFQPTKVSITYFDYSTNKESSYTLEGTDIYNIDSKEYCGFGFYSKILFSDSNNTGIYRIYLNTDKDGVGNKPANLIFEGGVMAITKSSSELETNQKILTKLSEMEESITSSIGSAVDDVVGSIDSASNNINSKLEESFDSLTSNLTDWFDDVFNGYGGSGTDQASDNFDTSAGELHTTETQLTDITNSSVTNYTDFAFNTNVLTTLGASLVYVVTWFTNFWDIGGLFTAVLNIGLALFVAFFILRLRGDP